MISLPIRILDVDSLNDKLEEAYFMQIPYIFIPWTDMVSRSYYRQIERKAAYQALRMIRLFNSICW
jgi:hypothetical protein